MLPARCVKSVDNFFNVLRLSHPAISSTKIKVKQYFYWPNVNSIVEEFVSVYNIFKNTNEKNEKKIVINPNIPHQPWQKVSCAFLRLKGR